MNWTDYVAFTATTALPGADNPEYLKLGILEEAHECLAAYATLQATIYGRTKRVRRGDPANVLQAKTDAAEIARRQLTEELGDLAWYVGRVGCYREYYCMSVVATISDVAEALQLFIKNPDALNAMILFEDLLSMSGIDLFTVLSANVAKLTARKAAGTIKGEGSR